jgi:hypothetical protein
MDDGIEIVSYLTWNRDPDIKRDSSLACREPRPTFECLVAVTRFFNGLLTPYGFGARNPILVAGMSRTVTAVVINGDDPSSRCLNG